MKTGKKIGIWFLVCSLMLAGLAFKTESAYAAPSASFSVSAGGTATLGSSVSVTVTVTGSENMAFAQVSLNYSADILEYQSGADSGGSGRVNLLFDCGSGQKTASRTLTFKAVGTGSASLTLDAAKATPMDAGSGDWMSVSAAGSAAVTVEESKTLSADAHVASIEVSPGTLNPAFNTDVFKYTMEVENEVTSIAVTATASQKAASITSVSGASDLKVGSNKVSIVCTAENGGTATYVITVTRKAAAAQTTTKAAEEPTTEAATEEPLTCEWNGTTYYVGQDFTQKSIPEGFEAADILYQDQTVKGAQYTGNNQIQLLYLTDSEKKNGQFYVYYPSSGLIGELVQVSFYEGNYIYLLDPAAYGEAVPSDLEAANFSVDDRELQGYKLTNPKDGLGEYEETQEDAYNLENVSAYPGQYVLLFGMNQDGTVCWYSYDTQEKTLQRFVLFASQEEEEEAAVETVSDGSENAVRKMLNTVKVYRIVLLGAAAMIVLLVLLCILIAANGRKKAEELGEAEEPEESEGSRELLKETEEKATAPKQKAPEVTRVLPARKIRRQTENTEKAVPEQKTQESKEPPAADSQPKEPQQTQTPEEKTEKDGLLPDSMERKKGKKQKPSGNTEDLGLEFFDVDDL